MRRQFLAAWRLLPHPIRWVIVLTVGVTLVVTGLTFMVLPGPGIPLVIAGLVILASEFAWAELLLQRMRRDGGRLTQGVVQRWRDLRNR